MGAGSGGREGTAGGRGGEEVRRRRERGGSSELRDFRGGMKASRGEVGVGRVEGERRRDVVSVVGGGGGGGGGGGERKVRRRSPRASEDDVAVRSSSMEILSRFLIVVLLALEIRTMVSTFLRPNRNRRRRLPELPLDETQSIGRVVVLSVPSHPQPSTPSLTSSSSS